MLRAFGASAIKRRKSAKARALLKGNMIVMQKTANELWHKIPPEKREEIRYKICEEFKFCKRKPTYDNINNAVGITLGVLVAAPFALVTVVFMLKFHFFNKLCDCDNQLPMLPKPNDIDE